MNIIIFNEFNKLMHIALILPVRLCTTNTNAQVHACYIIITNSHDHALLVHEVSGLASVVTKKYHIAHLLAGLTQYKKNPG